MEDAPPVFVHVVHHHVEPAELHRRTRRQSRTQQDIVVAMEGGRLPAEPMHGLGGPDIVGAVGGFAQFRGEPGDAFHLVLAGGPPGGRVARQVHHRVDPHQGEEGRHHRFAIDVGVGLFHVVPEIRDQGCGFAQHPEGVRMDRRAIRGAGGEGYAQPARIGADLVQERPSRRGRAVGITGAGAARRIEDGGAVAHAQGDGVLGGKPPAPFAEIRRHGVAPAGRLEADQSAAGGGCTDRAETVRGVRRRQHARADRRGRAAARAARNARLVPGVPGRAVQSGLAGETEAEFAGVGPPEDHHAGPFEPLDVLAVFRRNDVFEESRTPRGRTPGQRGAKVLQQIGYAPERPVGETVGDGRAALVVEAVGDRVDGPVPRLDPLDRGLQDLLRRDLATCDEPGQSERIVLFVVGEGGHRAPLFDSVLELPFRQSAPARMIYGGERLRGPEFRHLGVPREAAGPSPPRTDGTRATAVATRSNRGRHPGSDGA